MSLNSSEINFWRSPGDAGDAAHFYVVYFFKFPPANEVSASFLPLLLNTTVKYATNFNISTHLRRKEPDTESTSHLKIKSKALALRGATLDEKKNSFNVTAF